jgi:hypothetical protein
MKEKFDFIWIVFIQENHKNERNSNSIRIIVIYKIGQTHSTTGYAPCM